MRSFAFALAKSIPNTCASVSFVSVCVRECICLFVNTIFLICILLRWGNANFGGSNAYREITSKINIQFDQSIL